MILRDKNKDGIVEQYLQQRIVDKKSFLAGQHGIPFQKSIDGDYIYVSENQKHEIDLLRLLEDFKNELDKIKKINKNIR